LLYSLRILPLAATLALALSPPAHAQASGGAAQGTDASGADAEASVVPVIVARSVEASDAFSLDLLGSAVAQQSVTIFPAVAGEVARVGFRTGEQVRAGQVLLQLDDRQERLAADLASARVEAAQALFERYGATRGTGAVPASVVDDARTALRSARIELAQAREALDERTVRAPFAGVVGLAPVERGDRVTTESPITTLDDRRRLRVSFDVPEAWLARVSVGQPLTVANPAYPGRSFDGTVSEIDSRVDAVTRNVRLRADVPNVDDLLRPGMSFQVRLPLPGQTYVAVPELALQWGREGSHVWVVRDGRAVQVPVRSVRRSEGRVLVDGELRVGETVIVEGVQRLREGRPVRVIGNGGAV
jgi:membrane fusion protein (multidrug efflux system)